MQSARVRPFSPLAVVILLVAAGVPIVVAARLSQFPDALPLVLAAMVLLTLAIASAYAVDILSLVVGWLFLTAALSGYFWRLELPGFFTLTIDRIAIIGLVGVFFVAMAVGKLRTQWPGLLGWFVLLLLVWVGMSAQIHGWRLPPAIEEDPFVSPPFYLFFAGYVIPAVLFFLVVAAVRTDRQIRIVLTFFVLFGIYLTVTGLCEYMEKHGVAADLARTFIWPKFILNTELGIHTDRVRGPFLNSPDMGLTLVICLFATLLLSSRVSPPTRLLLWLVALPMPLVIFWTLTRSIWLAMVGGVVLAVTFWPKSRRLAVASGCVLLAAGLVLTVLNWSNLSSGEREKGGLGDAPPVISRIEQAYITAEIARDNPLTGVGLGHYRVAAPKTERMSEMGSRAMSYARGAVEHNNFLSLLAETGVPGMILYAIVVFGLLGVSIRLYRLLPATSLNNLNRQFVVLFWIVWLAYFINAMFRQTTSSPFPNSVFLVMGALIVGYRLRLRPHPIHLPPIGRPLELSRRSRPGRVAVEVRP